jgi:hypothetical protein
MCKWGSHIQPNGCSGKPTARALFDSLVRPKVSPVCCPGYSRIDSLLSILTWYGRKQGNGGTRTLRNQIPGYDFEPSRQQDGSFS